jgi:hypothetical protein
MAKQNSPAASVKPLTLSRETLRNLTVRSGLRTGSVIAVSNYCTEGNPNHTTEVFVASTVCPKNYHSATP